MVLIMEQTKNEITDKLDLNYIPSKRIGYSLQPCIYEISDVNKMPE